MGASNVTAAYTYWSHLDHAPFRLLAYMALVSLDHAREGSPARRYYGGREALAAALGYRVPEGGDEESQRQRDRALRNVKKAVSALLAAGAVEAVVKPAPGRQGEYALRLDGSTSGGPVALRNGDTSGDPVESERDRGDGNGDTSGGATGTPEVPNGDTSGNATGTPQVAPQEPKRNQSGIQEEESVGFPTQVPTAREDSEPPPNLPPLKCLHGLPANVRADGKPSCALCRRTTEEAS